MREQRGQQTQPQRARIAPMMPDELGPGQPCCQRPIGVGLAIIHMDDVDPLALQEAHARPNTPHGAQKLAHCERFARNEQATASGVVQLFMIGKKASDPAVRQFRHDDDVISGRVKAVE